MIALEEKSLVSRLKSPETRRIAFDQMVQVYQKMLYFHVRRIVIDHDDADDVLQNTFIKAWRYLDNFRGDSALKTWLYRISTNEALTFLKNKQKRSYSNIEDLQDDMRHSLREGKYFTGDEIQLKLQEAILTLPKRQSLVFRMRYFDELKYDEISEILEVTVGALKASYHHAVKKIEAHVTHEK